MVPQGHLHGQQITHSACGEQPQPTTVDIQGAGEWKRAPQMRAFYDETSEQAMVDHLKLVPRQIVGIVKEDPTVLRDFDTFWAALAGPD
jgi:hypothetical protein